jgi:hypothetical protein
MTAPRSSTITSNVDAYRGLPLFIAVSPALNHVDREVSLWQEPVPPKPVPARTRAVPKPPSAYTELMSRRRDGLAESKPTERDSLTT